ncbi:hypothetical protein QZH41_017343 [Actinostola sp. cb2023]|nr:hypothetical protein QZH41_017343 [Actinostola sp. cb2023]
MAFSAQPDHGQNDRKQRGFSSIVKISSKERTKFVPNPAAKPFVPSSNFDKLTRSNKTWSSANRRQNSLLKDTPTVLLMRHHTNPFFLFKSLIATVEANSHVNLAMQAETEISHLWSSRKLSSPGNCVNFRLPPNPSRVDKMVIDQLREHAKVEALVSRIERIRHSPLHQSISESVEQWQQTIKELQAKRREEMGSCSIAGRSRLGPGNRFYDSSDVQALVAAVRDVCLQTRTMRTTVWCAVHLVTCENIPKVESFPESKSLSTSEMNVGTGEVS